MFSAYCGIAIVCDRLDPNVCLSNICFISFVFMHFLQYVIHFAVFDYAETMTFYLHFHILENDL